MDAADIVEASACELVAAVRGRRVAAATVLRAFLDRTERLEPQLNTYVTFTPESALQAAAAVDARIRDGLDPGPLAGLPVSVKDLIAVGGVRQTFGSRLYADHIAADDAPSVARLRAAGACIVGKTTTSELGSKAVGDSPLTGITRNPWDTGRTPGGSSAGAAAGVAARLVPVALGTDGGGSVRIPAALCGLVGLKASFGRVPVWPASATPSVAHVGPLARSVGDAALLLSVLSGHDARDPGAMVRPPMDLLGLLASHAGGLRVGWVPELGYGHADSAVLEACEHAVFLLAGDGAIVARCAPLFARDPAPVWNSVFYGALARRLAQAGDWSSVGPRIDPALLRAARQEQESGLDEAQAGAGREELRAVLQRAFETLDLLALPTLPVTAPPVGVDVPAGHAGRNAVDWSYFTYPFNLSGHPAISLPVGLDAAGLPIGLQLVAAPGAEALLLRAAAALERLHPFRHRPLSFA